MEETDLGHCHLASPAKLACPTELHVLQGEGHFFVVTSARRTAEAIHEFLCQ
jgi:hypothetical protein